MSANEYEWPPPCAAPDTVLGQLQRGRGAGFLAALELPREESRALVRECLLHDTRYDRQTHARGRYFAELVVRVGFEMTSITDAVRPVAPEAEWRERNDAEWSVDVVRRTCEEMARRGDRGVIPFLRQYVAWGESWEEALDAIAAGSGVAACAGLDEVLFARFDDEKLADGVGGYPAAAEVVETWSATRPELFRLIAADREREARAGALRADEGDENAPAASGSDFEDQLMALGYRRVCDPHELAKRARAEHLELLCVVLQPGRVLRFRAAVNALRRLGGIGAQRALLAAAERAGEMRPYEASALQWALIGLPPERTLPLARAWARREPFPFQSLASTLLAKHATEEDIPLILERIRSDLSDDGDGCLGDWYTGLARVPGRGWLPGVEEGFLKMKCSMCRTEAVEALAALDPQRFASTYATECLWDCQAETIEAAMPHALLADARVRERVEELARPDPWRDPDVRSAAAARLG